MTLSFEMVYIIWPNVILLLSPRRLCIVRRLSVCPCVCLLAILRKTADQVFMKILPQTYLWTKKNLLTSGSHLHGCEVRIPDTDSSPDRTRDGGGPHYQSALIVNDITYSGVVANLEPGTLGSPLSLPFLSLIHIWRCRRIERCRSRWSPYH